MCIVNTQGYFLSILFPSKGGQTCLHMPHMHLSTILCCNRQARSMLYPVQVWCWLGLSSRQGEKFPLLLRDAATPMDLLKPVKPDLLPHFPLTHLLICPWDFPARNTLPYPHPRILCSLSTFPQNTQPSTLPYSKASPSCLPPVPVITIIDWCELTFHIHCGDWYWTLRPVQIICQHD